MDTEVFRRAREFAAWTLLAALVVSVFTGAWVLSGLPGRAGRVSLRLDLRPDGQSSVLVPRPRGHRLPGAGERHSAARSGGAARRPGRAPARHSTADHADRGDHSGRGLGPGPRRLDCHPGQYRPLVPHLHGSRSRRRGCGVASDERRAALADAAMGHTHSDPAEQIPLTACSSRPPARPTSRPPARPTSMNVSSEHIQLPRRHIHRAQASGSAPSGRPLAELAEQGGHV